MAKFDNEKAKEILKSKGLNYRDLEKLTNLSYSAISKFFNGDRENPQLETLLTFSKILGCSIDDFINWEDETPTPYYYERETVKLVQELYEDKELRTLLDTCKDLKPDELNAVKTLIQTMKNSKK